MCSALAEADVLAVLTGGAVVTIYSENEYESRDLDFIVMGVGKNVLKTMTALGFRKDAGGHFVHPKSDFWVEFPPGPLSVGDSPVEEVATRKTRTGTLKLLRPTESVMDRLAAYYHWNDLASLDQALAVASRQAIDLPRIEGWSKTEGHRKKFAEFLARLSAKPRK